MAGQLGSLITLTLCTHTRPPYIQVWTHYSPSGSLGDFASPEHRPQALACLNHLVTDALTHVPACLEYMARLHTPEVFRFCAIPQVMAIATLDKVYANADVFTGVVKIRKGLACKLILEANDMPELYACFARFAARIAARARALQGPTLAGTPVQEQTLKLCAEIQALCTRQAGGALLRQPGGSGAYTAGVVALVLVPVLAAMASALPSNLKLGNLSSNAAAFSALDYVRLAFCLLATLMLTFGLSSVVMAVWPPARSGTGAGSSSNSNGGKKAGSRAASAAATASQ